MNCEKSVFSLERRMILLTSAGNETRSFRKAWRGIRSNPAQPRRAAGKLGGSAELAGIFRNLLAADLWGGAKERLERRGSPGCGAGNGDHRREEHHEIRTVRGVVQKLAAPHHALANRGPVSE